MTKCDFYPALGQLMLYIDGMNGVVSDNSVTPMVVYSDQFEGRLDNERFSFFMKNLVFFICFRKQK